VTASVYRADIDGLRALAVVSVIAFHAGLDLVSGGFVGVDVFFVISGYLIARNIFGDLAQGQFTLAGFYERRIRRIQPALIVMVLVSMFGFAFFLTPVDYKSFGQSVGASLTFSSNLFFFLKSGYFDLGAETKPLLHTWSLAVEEQYYLLFPLFAAAVHRHKPHWLTTAIVLLLIASLVVSVVQVRVQPDAAFYLPFARVWELLLGALLARDVFPSQSRPWVRQACGIAGLVAIVGPVLWLSPASRFPGETALLPCLGTALIVYAGSGGGSAANTLLASRPFVFIGRISYSLYLWHWPLLVGARYVLFRELSSVELVLYATVAVALAWVSWRWVEQPFRTRGGGASPTRRSVFSTTAAVTAMGVVFAGITHLALGFPFRFDEPSRSYAAAALDTNPRRQSCDRLPPQRIALGQACEIGSTAPTEPSFIVIGDSFGDAVSPGISAVALSLGRKGSSLTHSGCFPLAGVRQSNPECALFMDAAVAHVVAHPEIHDVILVGRWTSALLGDRFGQVRAKGWFIEDEQSAAPSLAENRKVFERGFERTLAAFAGRRVAVVAHIPEQRYDVPRALALSAQLGHPAQPALPIAAHRQRQAELRAVFARLREHHHFELIDAGASICGESVCDVLRAGTALYADDNHLSQHGAMALGDVWAAALGQASTRRPAVLSAAAGSETERP
jgi:peptidoglycan/LPS O-acetylase OafA/YrhL